MMATVLLYEGDACSFSLDNTNNIHELKVYIMEVRGKTLAIQVYYYRNINLG